MADPKETKERTLAVRSDAEFEKDLAVAKKRTGIRSDSDLVRHAVRMIATGDAKR